MARKIVIAEINQVTLPSVWSAVEPELKCLAYAGKWGYRKYRIGSYGVYIVGKPQIKKFVAAMKAAIDECRDHFKDEQSIKQFDEDEAFLNSLLKLKAS